MKQNTANTVLDNLLDNAVHSCYRRLMTPEERKHMSESLAILLREREEVSERLASIDTAIRSMHTVLKDNAESSNAKGLPLKKTIADFAVEILKLHPHGLTNQELYDHIVAQGGSVSNTNSMGSTLVRCEQLDRREGRWHFVSR